MDKQADIQSHISSTTLTSNSTSEYDTSEINAATPSKVLSLSAKLRTLDTYPTHHGHHPHHHHTSSSSKVLSKAKYAISKESVRHDILNLVQQEAEIEETAKAAEDSDPDEEIHCCVCWKRCKCKNKKTKLKELRARAKKEPEIEKPKLSKKEKEEILMRKLQIIAKWAIFFIGIFDFCLAMQDSYILLRREMKNEYFFIQRVYNCDRLILGGYKIMMLAHVLHGITSVSLLFIHNNDKCSFALYWITTQMILLLVIIGEIIFKTRYAPNPLYALVKGIWRLCVDLIQLFIVIFRFYKLFNPLTVRYRKFASSTTLDRTINHELKLRTSNFIKRKAAVREAGNFHTLETIKKFHYISIQTGLRPDPKVVEEEIAHAVKNVFHKMHARHKSQSEITMDMDSHSQTT